MVWILKTDLTKKYTGSKESGNIVSNQDRRCLPITQGRSWGHSSSARSSTQWASPPHQADLTPRALPTRLAPAARVSLLFGPSAIPNLLHPRGLCTRCCPGLECPLATHPQGSPQSFQSLLRCYFPGGSSLSPLPLLTSTFLPSSAHGTPTDAYSSPYYLEP